MPRLLSPLLDISVRGLSLARGETSHVSVSSCSAFEPERRLLAIQIPYWPSSARCKHPFFHQPVALRNVFMDLVRNIEKSQYPNRSEQAQFDRERV